VLRWGRGKHAHRTVLLMYPKHCFRVQENLWHDVSQSLGNKRTSAHTIIRWDLVLYPYKIKVIQVFIAVNKHQRREFCCNVVCTIVPRRLKTACDTVMKPISTLMGLWTCTTQGSGPLKIHRVVEYHSNLQNAPYGVQSKRKGLLDFFFFWRAP